LGNYLYVPVYKISETKWKEMGKHISNTIIIREDEKIVGSLILKEKDKNVTLFTKKGLVKQVKLSDLEVSRFNKPITVIKLKDGDELVNASISKENTLFVTNNGYYLEFKTDEIPVVGTKASGVKGISLKDDYVVYASCIYKDNEYLNVMTNFNTGKRLKLSDLSLITRAKKGNMLFKKVKSKEYKIASAVLTNTKDVYVMKFDTEFEHLKNSEIPIMDITSTGSQIVKNTPDCTFLQASIIDFDEKVIDEIETLEEEPKSETKAEKQLSMDAFLEDFKI
jgi:topoisomerase-4 subunit A